MTQNTRLLSSNYTYSGPHGTTLNQNYAYDANGNLTTLTDAVNGADGDAYDAVRPRCEFSVISIVQFQRGDHASDLFRSDLATDDPCSASAT